LNIYTHIQVQKCNWDGSLELGVFTDSDVVAAMEARPGEREREKERERERETHTHTVSLLWRLSQVPSHQRERERLRQVPSYRFNSALIAPS
jgi:hypothetical protein